MPDDYFFSQDLRIHRGTLRLFSCVWRQGASVDGKVSISPKATSTIARSVQVVRQLLRRSGYTVDLAGSYGTLCDGKNEREWNKACQTTVETVQYSKVVVFDDSINE
ncbi:hypothetical protein CYMTET_37882, partial [Cymbomonas tetramitiformis]